MTCFSLFVMPFSLFAILLGVILPQALAGQFTSDPEVLERSNLPFRYELEQVTSEFQEKLRKELSLLEMDMYNEFLELTQDIDRNRRNLTKALVAELSNKVSDVMRKFDKVMVYSTERSKVLNDQMKELTDSFGNWVDYGVSSAASFRRRRHNSINQRTANSKRDESKRARWLTVLSESDTLLLQNPEETRKLLELELEDFPVVEDLDEIDSFLEALEYFESDSAADSDFTPKKFPSETKSKYVFRMGASGGASEEAPEGNPEPAGSSKGTLPRNCYDLLQAGNSQNGVYVIYPTGKGKGVEVWCDQESAGGGWTVIVNRRAAGRRLNSTATPIQYVHGFGIPSSNYWIGLEAMHLLTEGRSHGLRVLLQDFEGNDAFSYYSAFRVGSIDENYTLEVEGYDSESTAGDALSDHSGRPFVSPQPDFDKGCSHFLGVGWWYLDEPLCYQALATGQFQQANEEEDINGVEWTPWTRSSKTLQSLVFMIRPSNF